MRRHPAPSDWDALARAGGTLVVLMGVTTRAAVAEELMEGGRDPETPVAVIERGTGPAERVCCARRWAGWARSRSTGAGGHRRRSGGGARFARSASGPEARPPGPLRWPGAPSWRPVRVPGRHGWSRRSSTPGPRSSSSRSPARSTPTTGVRPCVPRRRRSGEYAWVVVTSANAVERFMAELRDARVAGRRPRRRRRSGDRRCVAHGRDGAGPGARRAQRPGARRAVPRGGSLGRCRDRAVLFPCADIAPGTIVDGLARRGGRSSG